MDDRLDGVRALVVDDDDDGRFLATVILKMAGASVLSASSTLQALAFWQVESPDLIVSDVKMPKHDGFDLIRAVRADERERGGHVLAISITGAARGDERDRALAAGFDAHLDRPVEPARLLEAVRLLRERGGAPPEALASDGEGAAT